MADINTYLDLDRFAAQFMASGLDEVEAYEKAYQKAEANELEQSPQDASCPKCGAQIMDPFGMGKVIHDVENCRS